MPDHNVQIMTSRWEPRAVHRKPKAVHWEPKALPLGWYVVAFQAENQNAWKTARVCGRFTPVYKC